jgi:hypothetical protein
MLSGAGRWKWSGFTYGGDDLEQHRERIVLGLDASRSL